MASLANLPGELHHLIFSNLSTSTVTFDDDEEAAFGKNHAGILALAHVSRTCRGLNYAVKPYLYAEVNLGSQNSQKLLALLKHLVNDPYSGTCVRWIRVAWSRLNSQELDCSDQDAKFLTNVARSLHLDVPQTPPADWGSGFLAGMVLLKSSGVELVDIEGHNEAFCSSIPEQAPRPELPYFTQFNHLLCHNVIKSTRDWHRLVNLSPNLQCFRSTMYPMSDPVDINWTNVTTLVVQERDGWPGEPRNITMERLLFVVRSCQKLHHARISVRERDGPVPMVNALRNYHKDTLRKLAIGATVYHHTDLEFSFSAFSVLESLTIHGGLCKPGFALIGLPQSLRELRMSGFFQHLQEDFENFSRELVNGLYPRFETARFYLIYGCYHEICPFEPYGLVTLEHMDQVRNSDEYEAKEFKGGTGKCKTQWEMMYGLVSAGVKVWVDG